MHKIAWSFNNALGGATVDPAIAPHLYPVAIGGRGYLMDLASRRFKRYSRAPQRVQTDQSQRPGEQTQSNEDLWPRTQQSFHQGAGQSSMELETALPYRFWRSLGVDVWERDALTLLKDTVQERTSTNVNQLLVTTGTHLGFVSGTNIRLYDGSVWGSAISLTGTVTAAASDGSNFYASADGKVKRITTAGVVTDDWTVAACQVLGFAKGRLIAGAGAVLYDLVPSVAAAAHYTHPWPGWTWTAVCDGPKAIYVAGKSGDRSAIYRVGIADNGTLNAPIQAAALPDGETVHSLSSYLGFVIIGTSKGVRFGVADSVGDITYGSPIPTSGPVYGLEPQDRFCWFTWSNPDAGVTGLGRIDLSTFVSDLTPAYATDLMWNASGDVSSVVTWGGRRWFTVQGIGAMREADTYVSSGYLDLSSTDYGITDSKVAQFVDLRHDPIEGAVAVWLDKDGAGFEPIATSSISGSTSASFQLKNKEGERFQLRLVLERGDQVPVVRRVRLRSHPLPERVSVFEVPIIISDTYDLGYEQHRSTADDARRLINLVASGRATSLQLGTEAFVVYPADYEWIPDKQSEDRTGWQGTLVMQLREVTPNG